MSLPLFLHQHPYLVFVVKTSRWCTNAIVVVLIVISWYTREHTIVSGERTSDVSVSWASNCCWTLAKSQATTMFNALFFVSNTIIVEYYFSFWSKRLNVGDAANCATITGQRSSEKKRKQNDNGNGKILSFQR